MKKTFLLILLLKSAALFSQSNFQKGLIVRNAGDTVKGFINYKEWSYNPASISFKTSEADSSPADYDATAITYFEVTGLELFRTYTLPISMDEVTPENLSTRRDTTKITKTVFLKIIQRGKNLTLLSYKDKIKTRYYVVDHNNAPEELIFSRYRSITNDEQVITISTFRNQLSNKASMNNVAVGSLTDLSYNLSSIRKVISKINGIDPKQAKSLESKNKTSQVRFFIGAGVSSSSAKFKGNGILGGSDVDNEPFNGFKSDVSIKPRFSAGMDMLFGRNNSSVFRAELSFSQFVNNMRLVESVTGVSGTDRQADMSYVFSQNTIALSPQYFYNFYNSESFKFFAGAGVSFNLSMYPKGNVFDKVPRNPVYYYEAAHVTNYYGLNSFWISMPVTAGVVIGKKIEVSGTYAHPISSLIGYPSSTKLRVTSLQLGVKYLLTIKRKG